MAVAAAQPGGVFFAGDGVDEVRVDALLLDDTQAIKKGAESVGVAPQHCGLTGQTENCQCMVAKPHLGVRMLERALRDPVPVFRWVVADSGYGRDPVLRAFCHDQRLSYVLAVPVDLPLVGVYGEAVRPDGLLARHR